MHLLETGKIILTNNVITCLNTFSLSLYATQTDSEYMVSICTSENCGNVQHDLQMLRNERLKFNKNPLLRYVNINSLRNKIIDLKKIIQYYFILSETKVDSSFPSVQFAIDNYKIKARRDRNCNGGGLIEYVRKGIISRSLKEYETLHSETICSEITISKKKWLYISIYRLPEANNLDSFFEELNSSLSKACCKYENFVIKGDFNVEVKLRRNGYRQLEEFSDMFDLTNLVDTETCVTNAHKSAIDLILTNKPSSFQKTMAAETGLSDCYKLVSTFSKSHYSRLKPKSVYYRNYRNFINSNFLKDFLSTLSFLIPTNPMKITIS